LDNLLHGFTGLIDSELKTRILSNRNVKCDRRRRPRGLSNVIPEDTRNIYTRMFDRLKKGILNKNEPLREAGGIGISWVPIRVLRCANRFA
jgi:hypothetical protein